LDQHILLDGGTGVGGLSLEEMERIDSLLLTHAHLDHIAGAALMLASVIDRRSTPLTIFAPAPVLDTLRRHLFNWELWPNFAVLPTEDNPVLNYREIHPEQPFELAGLSIEAIALSHTVPSYAYLIAEGERCFCFCGDTGPTQRLWERINEVGTVEQLFIELSYPASEAEIARISGHYDLASLANDLQRLKQPLQVNLMHAKPGYEDDLSLAVTTHAQYQPLRVHHCRAGQYLSVL